jgi:hypothetical protein
VRAGAAAPGAGGVGRHCSKRCRSPPCCATWRR